MQREIKISAVGEGDLTAVFNLSNSDSVRAASFRPEKIELPGHKKWFAAKLADPNTIMLKAELGEDFAGQVRLDIEGESALIGVSVDDSYRGKGIASCLLQAAIKEAKKRGIKVIEAFIKPENSASIGLFEKNGFVYEKEVEVSGTMARRYLYKL